MIDVKVTTEWNGDRIIAAMQAASDHGLTAAAAVGADAAARIFGSVAQEMGGGGVIGYMVNGKFKPGKANGKRARGRKVFAGSTPPNPPGVRTGNLRNSVCYVSPEGMGQPGKAAFGTAVEYGRHLEFGWLPPRVINVHSQKSIDRARQRVPARPWLLPAARQASARMAAAYRAVTTETLNKALRAGGVGGGA